MSGRGLDFEEVRNYVAGDDIRNIDWKVTARTKKTHSKVFVEEKERPSFAIVDQSQQMLFGSKQYLKSVIGAQVSALHAFRTIKMGDRFGGLVFNDNESQFVSPKRNRASVQFFLKIVERMNNNLLSQKVNKRKVNRLNEVLTQAKNYITHDFVLSIISDFSTADENTFKTLVTLSKHNDIILFHISDPMENKIPDSRILLSDGKLQTLLNQTKKLDKYNQFKKDQNNELKVFAKKHRIILINLNTEQDLEEQVKNVFS